jgi:hypothetical protein
VHIYSVVGVGGVGRAALLVTVSACRPWLKLTWAGPRGSKTVGMGRSRGCNATQHLNRTITVTVTWWRHVPGHHGPMLSCLHVGWRFVHHLHSRQQGCCIAPCAAVAAVLHITNKLWQGMYSAWLTTRFAVCRIGRQLGLQSQLRPGQAQGDAVDCQ